MKVPYLARTVSVTFILILLNGCADKKAAAPPVPNAPPVPVGTATWTKVALPFKATNITAIANVFWVCGENEMVASSGDGGNTWRLSHSSQGGATLLAINFVDEKVGYAAGERKLLLSTSDGGKNWKSHHLDDDVHGFSFSDERNGIAVIGGDTLSAAGLWEQPTIMNGSVKLTHDGGDHWQDIPALNSKELLLYTQVLGVASLDASNYLVIRRQPTIEDVFFVTHDAGKSWSAVHQRDDATNRELTRWVYVHGHEYWAFGMELIHRDVGGGYGVPLALHSRDGESWTHAPHGPKEFGGCNQQGCYMWDGTVESLYGEREQYWALPQDGTMSQVWALAQHRMCTLGESLECGPAAITSEPQPRANRPAAPPQSSSSAVDQPPRPSSRRGLPRDCVQCALSSLPWNLQQKSVLFVTATLRVGPEGDVKEVVKLEPIFPQLRAALTQQLSQWLFKASSEHAEVSRDIHLIVQCGFDNSLCEIVSTVPVQ
jgi:hypothetical protein